MNKKQLERRAYAKPAIEVIGFEVHNQLMDTSFPSDHNKAGDDGEDLHAKQGWFDEEEESLTPGPSPTGEGRNYPWD